MTAVVYVFCTNKNTNKKIGYFLTDPYPILAQNGPKYPRICGQMVKRDIDTRLEPVGRSTFGIVPYHKTTE